MNVQRIFVAVRSALPAHSGNSFTFIRPIVGSPGFPVPVLPAFSKRGKMPVTVLGSLPVPVALLLSLEPRLWKKLPQRCGERLFTEWMAEASIFGCGSVTIAECHTPGWLPAIMGK